MGCHRAPFIVSMSPPGYPSAWLRPRRARFRFAQQDHCSSSASCGRNFRMGRDTGRADCWVKATTDCSGPGVRTPRRRSDSAISSHHGWVYDWTG